MTTKVEREQAIARVQDAAHAVLSYVGNEFDSDRLRAGQADIIAFDVRKLVAQAMVEINRAYDELAQR